MKAEKSVTGVWRVRASKQIDGKRYRKWCEGKTKDEALRNAYNWTKDVELENAPKSKKIGKAIDEYIELRAPVLSPTTIASYRSMRRNAFRDIENYYVETVPNSTLQKWINKYSVRLSRKSLSNYIGLLSAALLQYDRKIVLKLPAREKPSYNVPTLEQSQKIMEAIKGTDIELQVLFAMVLGLRVSEIQALRWENLHGNVITIHGAMVYAEGKYIDKKTNKSISSARTLEVPDIIMEKLVPKDSGLMFADLNANVLRKKWRALTRANGLPDVRLHDLRHFCASQLLLMGVPDKYILERMGQNTMRVLKDTYQHTFSEEHQRINAMVNLTWSNQKVPTSVPTISESDL